MNNILKQTRYLFKDISQRAYFWPLVGLMFLGIVLDVHSTCFLFPEYGLLETSRWVVHLYYQFFSPAGLGAGMAIFLAMVVSKIILLVAVALALFLIIFITKGNPILFRASFICIFVGSAYNLYAGIWNYGHYFFGV